MGGSLHPALMKRSTQMDKTLHYKLLVNPKIYYYCISFFKFVLAGSVVQFC